MELPRMSETAKRCTGTLAIVALSLAGCASPYRALHDARDLHTSERLVVVEVVMEGATLANYAAGIFMNAGVVAAGDVPTTNGKVDTGFSGYDVDGHGFDASGGVVAIGAPPSGWYVVGARVRSMFAAVPIETLVPFIMRIPPGTSRCEYAGTIHVSSPYAFEIRDELPAHRAKLSSAVAGCELVANIGTPWLRPR